jgi:hypothetical protein
MERSADPVPKADWWSQRRVRYNVSLVIAGVSAFALYAALVWLFRDRLPDVEITALTTLFQAFGYLVAMAVANVCYLLGPWSERVLKPTDIGAYRERTYGLGLWFSVLLPFVVPASVLITVIASA